MRSTVILALLVISAFRVSASDDADDLDALLRRARATQIEAVRLLEGTYSAEQSLLIPANDRLVVVYLSQDPQVHALLHRIELRIDNRLAPVYSHRIGDLEKLLNGAVIPLHATFLSSGKHSLDVSIIGVGDDEEGPATAHFAFRSGPKPHFIEIRIEPDGIRFAEWR